MLENLTGMKVNDTFNMTGEPNFYNFKLLLDVYPLKNKHWHITAGVYAGSSKIGKAVNTIEDAPTLIAVNMYNQMYDKAANDMPVLDWAVTFLATSLLSSMTGIDLNSFEALNIEPLDFK